MADGAEVMQVDGEDEPVYPRSGVVFDAVVPDDTSAYKWLVPKRKREGGWHHNPTQGRTAGTSSGGDVGLAADSEGR